MFKPDQSDLELFNAIHDEVVMRLDRNGEEVYGERIFNPNTTLEETPPDELEQIMHTFATNLFGRTLFSPKRLIMHTIAENLLGSTLFTPERLEYIDPIFTIHAEAPVDTRTLTMKSKTQAAWFQPSRAGDKVPLMQVDLNGSLDILKENSLAAESVSLAIKDQPQPHYQMDITGAHNQTYFRRENLGTYGSTGIIRLGRSEVDNVLDEEQTQMLETLFFHQALLTALKILKMPLVAISPRK